MRYPIGTRVRLVYSVRRPESAGQEGVIDGYRRNINPISGRVCKNDYHVTFPNYLNEDGDTYWGCMHDQLEPIINDGNQLSTWDECIKESGLNWRPGKVPA